jgi:mRNA deadenylase 3'-5' endonuclease subunit Ccr4
MSAVVFTVATYNVLASAYASSREFPYALPRVLAWKNRIVVIGAEVAALNADVLCLQVTEANFVSSLR